MLKDSTTYVNEVCVQQFPKLNNSTILHLQMLVDNYKDTSGEWYVMNAVKRNPDIIRELMWESSLEDAERIYSILDNQIPDNFDWKRVAHNLHVRASYKLAHNEELFKYTVEYIKHALQCYTPTVTWLRHLQETDCRLYNMQIRDLFHRDYEKWLLSNLPDEADYTDMLDTIKEYLTLCLK